MDTDPASVAVAIITKRLAYLDAEMDYKGPMPAIPVMDEFMFLPSGDLVSAEELHRVFKEKRTKELSSIDEERLRLLMSKGIELDEYQKAFLNRHQDPAKWEEMQKEE